MTTTTNYDIANMTPHKRASIRQELTDHWEYTNKIASEYSTSNAIVSQFIETAIHGLDAVDRVEKLASDLFAEGGPINNAIATEITNALKGLK
jgi:hypothetical protein